MDYFRTRPEYDAYRDYFEDEFRREMGWEPEAEQQNQEYQSHSRSGGAGSQHHNLGYDPYRVLEVDANASWEEIEKTYKKMARQYHPDRYRDDKGRETATKLMAKINASYDFLKKKHGKK